MPDDRGITRNGQAGYLLLEALIALAISSSLVFLLVSSLINLNRSQERILGVMSDLNTDVFEDALMEHFFQSVRPTYKSQQMPFSGAPLAFSGTTQLDGFGNPDGTFFEARLLPDGEETLFHVRAAGRELHLARFASRDCHFLYVDLLNNTVPDWQQAAVPGTQSAFAYRLQYADPVPRQIRILCNQSGTATLVAAWPLGAALWPAARSEDAAREFR